MISQALLVAIMMLLAAAGGYMEPMPVPMPACPTSCGNLAIPFPFGTSSDCNLDESFLITCNHNYNPPKPFLNLGSIEVLDISLDGKMKVVSSLASDCYDYSCSGMSDSISGITLSEFSMSSTRNLDTYGLIQASELWNTMTSGCASWFDNTERVMYGTCSAMGCCQNSIPERIKDFLVNINNFRNFSGVHRFSSCDYVFVLETDASESSSTDLKNPVPVVLDWSVGNLSCMELQSSLKHFACRAANSECIDSSSGAGYRCQCVTGFEGNPYLVDGCHDIDECIVSEPCEGTCTNLIGSYSCSCPPGFTGDGKIDGSGCYPQRLSLTTHPILFYISLGLVVPAVGSSWIFWRRKQKKVVNLRRNLFIRNGGKLLEAMQSNQKTLSIFTAEDLKKATNNYDDNNVVCQEHHFGITYKGILPEVSQIVTIKSCHAFDQCNIEVLISKLVTLSQINHKNVVKLLGCCLETQVPLVVYESITVKSLLDYMTDDRLARSLSWHGRLRIAADTAGVLAYMHSATSVPFIHGSLNSSSIFLDHGFAVKVNGFAVTCLECSCVEFYGGLSSDVYSFGFILAELMTGKDVMSPEMLVGEGNLAKYFFGSSGGGDLLTILDDRVATDDYLGQLTEVAEIAKLCLSSSSQERPTMKEVATVLESIIFRDSRLSSTRTQATRQLHLESSD